jgi:hypothetical protein
LLIDLIELRVDRIDRKQLKKYCKAVRSWSIFVGVFGKRKYIILAQNSFEYADGLCDLDYTAIPLDWVEDVQIIAQRYTPEVAVRSLVASFGRLRDFIRNFFTRKYVSVDDLPLASAQDTTRKGKHAFIGKLMRTRNLPIPKSARAQLTSQD